MRIIIYTGKGGVGKTSIAAATGIKLAKKGLKSLVISTDMAHSLSDSFGVELNHYGVEVKENLYAMELNPQTQLENKWDNIYQYMVNFMKIVGISDVFAEELTMLPGIEELFSLLEIYDQYKEKNYDCLILDFPPTASTLRLLSFFDVVSWYMEKFFNMERKSIKFMRTFTKSFMEVPLPDDSVFDSIQRIYDKMAAVKAILADSEITSVRLVINPEGMVINESQRAYTYLNLYGFNVDSVIVNKVLPVDELRGEFYKNIMESQERYFKKIKSIFSALETFHLPLIDKELKGIDSLENISEKLYKDQDPLKVFHNDSTIKLEKKDGEYHYQIYMPYLKKGKFKMHQKGGVLIIKVGTYKQKLHLPQVLSNKVVKKAKYSNQKLHLYF